MVLRGIKRQSGRPINQKLPITPIVLRDIRKQLNLEHSPDITFWAACLVAFFSFFRKSNLFPPSIAGFNKDLHLRRKDIILFSWGAIIVVRWSKTVQFQQRKLLIPIPKLHHSTDLCPVFALQKAFATTLTADPEGPAFMYSTSPQRLLPYTYNSFTSKLKHTLTTAGYASNKYSGHSFRRGGATFAMRAGVPFNLIQAQGDWKTNAYERYLDKSFIDRLYAIRTMANKIS